MTTIYLVRHAEAEGNAYRRIHGQYDSLITPNGLRQIEALAKRFADVPVNACYASDLYRTRKTAEAVYVPKGLALVTDARLREVNLGRWEDVPFGYLERFEADDMYKFNHDERLWSVEGSERWQTYTERFVRALKEVAQNHEGQTVTIFSHGCVLRGVQKRLSGMDKVPYCDNTAVSKLVYEDGAFQFDYLNDNSHLPENISTFARPAKGVRVMRVGEGEKVLSVAVTEHNGEEPTEQPDAPEADAGVAEDNSPEEELETENTEE